MPKIYYMHTSVMPSPIAFPTIFYFRIEYTCALIVAACSVPTCVDDGSRNRLANQSVSVA